MKKMLAVAAVAALISAPAFAAPEAYNVEIGANGQMRSSPPSAAAEAPQAQPSQATWTPAPSPGRPSAAQAGSQGGAKMMKASDEPATPAPKKKHHKKKKKDAGAPGSEAPKAAPAPGQPAGQGQQ
ncbi:MAG: hypothetical protein HY053_04610 [Proteobacteria bacterium]|nr:hypothetical protein [Pseudomonadota bacterium]